MLAIIVKKKIKNLDDSRFARGDPANRRKQAQHNGGAPFPRGNNREISGSASDSPDGLDCGPEIDSLGTRADSGASQTSDCRL